MPMSFRFIRKPEYVSAVRWYGPGHPEHRPNLGVEALPELTDEEKQLRHDRWGYLATNEAKSSFTNPNGMIQLVSEGDWIILSNDTGVPLRVTDHETFTAMYDLVHSQQIPEATCTKPSVGSMFTDEPHSEPESIRQESKSTVRT
jgi:hypothetical protein